MNYLDNIYSLSAVVTMVASHAACVPNLKPANVDGVRRLGVAQDEHHVCAPLKQTSANSAAGTATLMPGSSLCQSFLKLSKRQQ